MKAPFNEAGYKSGEAERKSRGFSHASTPNTESECRIWLKGAPCLHVSVRRVAFCEQLII